MSRSASPSIRSDATARPSRDPNTTLAGLLDGLARIDPDRIALRDDECRESWSGRAPRSYTRMAALTAVRDLSSRLLDLGLPSGSAIAIVLAAGTEACLAILASERAGLVPVPIPVFVDELDLETRLALVDARAIVTQTRVGRLRPAATASAVAARRFRIRFILAFGPDVPDGVVDLDGAPSSAAPAPAVGPAAETGSGIGTFETEAGESRAVFRPSSAWLAASAVVLAATGWRARDTVVTCVAPDDLKGLATGLIACLASGATCEMQAVFEPDRLAASRAGRVHLVLPGWTERAIAQLGLAAGAASVMFVHPSSSLPASSGVGHSPWQCPVVDAVSLGEAALVAVPRGRDGRPATTLVGSYPPGAEREMLAVRSGLSGEWDVRGWASVSVPFREAGLLPRPAGEDWRPCGFVGAGGVRRLIGDDLVSEA